MATYVVARWGNDSTGTGSSLNPFLTPQKADSLAQPGDTVQVIEGDYSQPTTIIATASGTALNRILWKAVGRVRINNTAVAFLNDATIRWNGSYLDIVGFEATGPYVRIGIDIFGAYCRILHCFAHECGTSLSVGQPGSGFYDYGLNGATNNEFGYCKAVNCGPFAATQAEYHTYYLSGQNVWMHDCVATNSSGYGFVLSGISNGMVEHCTSFYNNYAGYALSGSAGFADHTTFRNNISYANEMAGSSIVGNGFIKVNSPGGTNNLWTNNVAFGNFLDYAVVSSPGETITSTNAIHADPLFVNYQSGGYGDYRLTSSSPCKDAGIPSSSLYDMNGVSRPQNGAYDIGAYEFVPTVTNQRGGLSLIRA